MQTNKIKCKYQHLIDITYSVDGCWTPLLLLRYKSSNWYNWATVPTFSSTYHLLHIFIIHCFWKFIYFYTSKIAHKIPRECSNRTTPVVLIFRQFAKLKSSLFTFLISSFVNAASRLRATGWTRVRVLVTHAAMGTYDPRSR